MESSERADFKTVPGFVFRATFEGDIEVFRCCRCCLPPLYYYSWRIKFRSLFLMNISSLSWIFTGILWDHLYKDNRLFLALVYLSLNSQRAYFKWSTRGNCLKIKPTGWKFENKYIFQKQKWWISNVFTYMMSSTTSLLHIFQNNLILLIKCFLFIL